VRGAVGVERDQMSQWACSEQIPNRLWDVHPNEGTPLDPTPSRAGVHND
jgi:hypothetical protein